MSAEWDAIMAAEKRKFERRRAKAKRDGYTHVMVMWIHPAGGGDDYQVEAYSQGEFSNEEIARIASRYNSIEDSDFTVEAL